LYLNANPGTFEKYFKGKMLTIQYAGLSDKTGIPLQPKATIFRTYEGSKDDVAEIMDKILK
jgi:hypothetical protein